MHLVGKMAVMTVQLIEVDLMAKVTTMKMRMKKKSFVVAVLVMASV